MKQINKQIIKVDFMRDFHGRRVFIANGAKRVFSFSFCAR